MQTANHKKNSNYFENPTSPERFDFRAKAPPSKKLQDKRSEKGYGDENGAILD